MVTAAPCPRCGGTGPGHRRALPDCRGEGRTVEERTYTVDVPAGVDTGSTLRLTGRGAVGPRGGPAGDLYVHVRVEPHDRFARDGDDLLDELHRARSPRPRSAPTSTFETLDGAEDLVIPRGHPERARSFRLRGRGVPHVERPGPGRPARPRTSSTRPPTSTDEEEELSPARRAAGRGGGRPPRRGFLSRIRSAFK